MTTALKARDVQLATAQRQLQGVQEADANDKQSLADIIANLRGAWPCSMLLAMLFGNWQLPYLPQRLHLQTSRIMYA